MCFACHGACCHHWCVLPPADAVVQYKPIRTTRFVVAGTIEERILKLQEKKQAVFEGTVGECVSMSMSSHC